jgi:hypothetical protein
MSFIGKARADRKLKSARRLSEDPQIHSTRKVVLPSKGEQHFRELLLYLQEAPVSWLQHVEGDSCPESFEYPAGTPSRVWRISQLAAA